MNKKAVIIGSIVGVAVLGTAVAVYASSSGGITLTAGEKGARNAIQLRINRLIADKKIEYHFQTLHTGGQHGQPASLNEVKAGLLQMALEDYGPSAARPGTIDQVDFYTFNGIDSFTKNAADSPKPTFSSDPFGALTSFLPVVGPWVHDLFAKKDVPKT